MAQHTNSINTMLNDYRVNLDGARLSLWRDSDNSGQDYDASCRLDADFVKDWTTEDMSGMDKRRLRFMVAAWDRSDYKRFGELAAKLGIQATILGASVDL